MSEQNKAIVRRFFEEVWNRNNLDLADELLAVDYVDHNAPPGSTGGIEGYKQSVAMFRSAFPDINFALDDILGEGDRVAIRLTGRGTHQGNFIGIAPTGKQVSFGGMTFIRLQNGKIVERWGLSDMPGLIQQLRGGAGAGGHVNGHAASSDARVLHMAPMTVIPPRGCWAWSICARPPNRIPAAYFHSSSPPSPPGKACRSTPIWQRMKPTTSSKAHSKSTIPPMAAR